MSSADLRGLAVRGQELPGDKVPTKGFFFTLKPSLPPEMHIAVYCLIFLGGQCCLQSWHCGRGHLFSFLLPRSRERNHQGALKHCVHPCSFYKMHLESFGTNRGLLVNLLPCMCHRVIQTKRGFYYFTPSAPVVHAGDRCRGRLRACPVCGRARRLDGESCTSAGAGLCNILLGCFSIAVWLGAC